MSPAESMSTFLLSIGARRAHCLPHKYVLDGFDSCFYLIFDCESGDDGDAPGSVSKDGTCDILITSPGVAPSERAEMIRLMADCREHHVKRLLFTLGVSRFSEQTRKALYETTSPLRTQ